MYFILTVIILLLTIFYLIPTPKPYAGVYTRPDKWFYIKATFIYSVIRLRKFLASRKPKGSLPSSIEKNTSSEGGYGVKSNDDTASMEQVNQLSDHPLAIDAVLLSCGGKDGSYLVAAIARRKLKMNNTIFCLRIPEVGVLVHPKHPDTTMFTDTEEFWDSEGLQMKMIEPMKKWTVYYDGEMILQSTNERVKVKLQGEYTSELPYFDFDSDMDPWTIARAFAKETWSKEYFDRIKSAHQCHYEQFGDLHGNVSVNGTEYKLELNVMRDHTHGSKRDWRLMHRYGIQNFTTSNGFRGFIGVVSQPSTFSSLELGYVYTPQGECLPVQEVDLPLWRHGEGGNHPKDFGFKFKAGDKWHDIQVRVIDAVEIFMGWEWEARVIERFCRYEVDGTQGWGVSEWHFRNRGGRPSIYADQDPENVKNQPKYGEFL